MPERFESKLPKGVRKHNREVLAQARKTQDPRVIAQAEQEISGIRTAEDREWEGVERTLSMRVEGYPENFSPQALGAVRDFFSLRRRLNIPREVSRENVEFQAKFPDVILEEAAPAFRVISQLYSPKGPVR